MVLNNNNNNDCCKCTTPEYEIILNEQGPQGRQGEKGDAGFTPIISVKNNTPSNYTLNILTQDGQITTPNLKANLPSGGATGQVLTKNSGEQNDCSWQNLPNATTEQNGIVQLATENDLDPDSEGEVDDSKAVTPNLLVDYTQDTLNTKLTNCVTTNTEQTITGTKTFDGYTPIYCSRIFLSSEQPEMYIGDKNKPLYLMGNVFGNYQDNSWGNVVCSNNINDYIPQATATTLGGIKANEKDDTDTQEVKIDPATGLLYTQAGGVTDAYTKAETDELLDNKQDTLTAVSPLNIDYKIRSNLSGFNYTTDGTGVYASVDDKYLNIRNDTNFNSFFWMPFGETNNACITINEDGSNTWTNYIDIPYKLNQIVKIPKAPYNSIGVDYMRSTALLGFVDNNNNFFPIIGSSYLTLISTKNENLYLSSNNYYTNNSIVRYSPSSDTTTRQYNNPDYAYIQLYEDPDTGLFSFQRYGNIGATNNIPLAQTYKYNITNQNYINRLKQINTIRIFPTSTIAMNGRTPDTAYPVNNIKLFDTGVELFSYNDNFTTLESSTNYFDLSGQVAENYLSLKIDNNTIKVNSNGELYSTVTVPDNITTQGNTFNGANQLVQLDSSGKLPAVDGSQLTNLPGGSEPPTNMVTTDTDQTITGVKTFSRINTTGTFTLTETLNNYTLIRASAGGIQIGYGLAQPSLDINSGSIYLLQDYQTQAIIKKENNNYGIRFSLNNQHYFLGTVNPSYSNAKQIVTTADTNGVKFWKGTQTEYDGIATKDENTLYIITG